MKGRRDARLPIFRSGGQAAVLVELFVYARQPLSLTDLASRAGLSVGTVHAEVDRLEDADLVGSHRVGRARLVSANPESPFYPELRGLLLKAFGPSRLLHDRISPLEGVDEAFIYGSWAASEAGLTTGQPRDIDVMVIGYPDLDRLYREIRLVEAQVERPINVTVLSPEEWEAAESGFLESVGEGPRVPVV